MAKKIIINGNIEQWELKNSNRIACRCLKCGVKYIENYAHEARNKAEKCVASHK